VILASRPDGIVRVSDVAKVSRGAKDREVITRLNGEEAVEIAVYKEGDANTVAVARSVKHRVDKLQLPREMKLRNVADQSRFIEEAVSEVVNSALLGGLLAILVLYAFLRDLRSTLVIGLSIPVSVLATFVIMYRFHLSLNLMSLGGLALSVGNLVDSSIVVLESIHRKRKEGLDALRAASQGTRTVAMAVTASILTSVAVFMPLVFVEGFAGQLIRDQALTISFSHLVSLAVALTLIPTTYVLLSHGAEARQTLPAASGRGRSARAMGWITFVAIAVPRAVTRAFGWLGARIKPAVDTVLRPFDAGHRWVERTYPVAVRRALERPARVLGFSAAALAVSIALGFTLPLNLFPSSTQGEFRFKVRLPEGTAIGVTDETLDHLAAVVKNEPGVRFVHTTAGQAELAAFAGSAREPNRGQLAVLMERSNDGESEERVATRLRRAMEQVPGLTYEFERPAIPRLQGADRDRGVQLRPRHAAHGRHRRGAAHRLRARHRGRPDLGPERRSRGADLLRPRPSRRDEPRSDGGVAPGAERRAGGGGHAVQRPRAQAGRPGPGQGVRALSGRRARQPRRRPQRRPGRAARGRGADDGGARPRRHPAHRPAARGGGDGEPQGPRSRIGGAGDPGRAGRDTGAVRRAGDAGRTEPRAGGVVRLAALRAPPRGIPGLSGDGEPVRVPAASLRDHVLDAHGADRRGVHDARTHTSFSVMVLIGLVVLPGSW
jgi:multidrug efflux pump subunit AcrB